MAENYYYAPIHTEILCEHKKAKGYQTYPYHRHNGYEIFLFLSGNVLLYIDNECYRMIPGDIIIIPPVSRHLPHGPFCLLLFVSKKEKLIIASGGQ